MNDHDPQSHISNPAPDAFEDQLRFGSFRYTGPTITATSFEPTSRVMRMCTQVYIVYKCGCKKPDKFEQCDRLYNQQSNLQCDITIKRDEALRNNCSEHMTKESKATPTTLTRSSRMAYGCNLLDLARIPLTTQQMRLLGHGQSYIHYNQNFRYNVSVSPPGLRQMF